MILLQLDETTAANRRIPLYAVDIADGFTPETGLSSFVVDVDENGGGRSAGAGADPTEIDATNMPGYYYYEATAAELSTLGMLVISIKHANMRDILAVAQVVGFDPNAPYSIHSAADVWSVGTREITGGVIDTNNDKTGYTASTVTDKTGYSISGTINTLDDLDAALDSAHGAGSWETATGFSVPNEYDTVIAALQTDLDNPNQYKATGFSTHSAADVWAVGAKVITGGVLTTPNDYKATGFSTHAAADIWSVGTRQLSGTISDFDELDIALDSAHGAGSWLTGGGGAGANILVIPSIPKNIDVSVKDVRIALYVTDQNDDLPTTGEITEGTIKIERSADGGASWSTIRNDVACSKHAGAIYYDENFSSGGGYSSADMIKITFKSQKVTISANDHEIADATDGIVFITRMDSGLSGGGPSAGDIADAVWDEPIADHTNSAQFGGKNQLVVPSETLADYKATGFSTHAAADIWSVGARTITGGTITTVDDKTGYSISGTLNTLDDLENLSAAAVWSETGRALTTPNDYKATGFATATDLQTVDDNVDLLIIDTDRLRYRGFVWLDDAASNINTVLGTDGVPENPVSTLAAAITIATTLNIKCLMLINNSSITLSQSFANWLIMGTGANNTITLNGQSVDFAEIHHCVITGTQGGTESVDLHDCYLDTILALSCDAIHCHLTGDFTIKASNDVLFSNCASAVAGNATPIMTYTAGATDVSFRHYSGGLEIKAMTSDHTMSYESDGQIIINANCTGGALSIRGNMTKTDNSGNVTITEGAALNRDAIADAIWNEILSGHVTAGSAGEEVRRLRGLNGEFLVAEYNFTGEDNDIIEFWQYDTLGNYNTHNKSTGLIGSWIINTTFTLGKPVRAKSKKLT